MGQAKHSNELKGYACGWTRALGESRAQKFTCFSLGSSAKPSPVEAGINGGATQKASSHKRPRTETREPWQAEPAIPSSSMGAAYSKGRLKGHERLKAAASTRAQELADKLLSDDSPLALRLADPERLTF